MAAILVLFIVLWSGGTSAFNLKTWMQNPSYTGTAPVRDQIEGYAFPYGIIGMLNHWLLTWTFICLCTSRRPLMPWRRLSDHGLDMALGLVALSGAVCCGVVSAVRCGASWQMVLLSMWQICEAVTVCAAAVHVAFVARCARTSNAAYSRDNNPQHVGDWLPLYFLGGFLNIISTSSPSSGPPFS